jgi:hypothetical protein
LKVRELSNVLIGTRAVGAQTGAKMGKRYERDSEEFVRFLKSHGFTYDEICEQGVDTGYAPTSITADFIEESGGLLSAISVRCVRILASLLPPQKHDVLDTEKLTKLQTLLPHKNPHLDEYFSGLLFRACLPKERQNLQMGETALYSIDNDLNAQAQWKCAAVLGIGAGCMGGAQPLFLFDEHEHDNHNKTVSNSLAMLMRKHFFPDGTTPPALARMIAEINHIDSFGGAYHKNISIYCKFLQDSNITVPTQDSLPNEATDHKRDKFLMDPTWKTAMMDAVLITFLLELFTQAKEPITIQTILENADASLKAYKNSCFFRGDPDFASAVSKIRNLIRNNFMTELSENKILLTLQAPNGERMAKLDAAGAVIPQLLLFPYLPTLMEKYWGATLSGMLLYPFWEARIDREVSAFRILRELKRVLLPLTQEHIDVATSFGSVTLLFCSQEQETPLRILEVRSATEELYPNTFNRFTRLAYEGKGCVLIHNERSHTTFLGKGYGLTDELWAKICEEVIRWEGESNPGEHGCGCWHMIRKKTQIAPFLLNRNPAHQYVPETQLNARILADIICKIQKDCVLDKPL